MTHLGFVASCFAMGLAVPALLGFGAWRRLALARRRLAAIDPRGGS